MPALFIPLTDFLKTNGVQLLVYLLIATVAYTAYYFTMRSLKNLKTDVHAYYPFDLFFPKGGKWSIGYFLIIILFLTSIIFFLAKGNFDFKLF